MRGPTRVSPCEMSRQGPPGDARYLYTVTSVLVDVTVTSADATALCGLSSSTFQIAFGQDLMAFEA
jgi:hypothetical protein